MSTNKDYQDASDRLERLEAKGVGADRGECVHQIENLGPIGP